MLPLGSAIQRLFMPPLHELQYRSEEGISFFGLERLEVVSPEFEGDGVIHGHEHVG